MPEYNININKRYDLPENLKVINYDGAIIVVAPDYAKWIVLDSQAQVSVLSYFKNGHTIQEALNNPSLSDNDINYTVTQIEARKFYSKKIQSSTKRNHSLHLYLTNKCNLSCPHCYMFSGKPNDNELSTEEVIKLLQDYRNYMQGKNITISGGEPTSRQDLDLIVKVASDLGIKVNLLTNGTLLSLEKITNISKYIDSVQVSIDGFSEESNSRVRGHNNFSKALKAIDAFVKCNVKTSIAVTPPFDILQNHIEDYVLFAKELCTKYEDMPFEIKFSEGLIRGRNINPSQKFNYAYNKMMEKLQEELYGPDYDLIPFVEALSDHVILDNCTFGALSVASNGDVYFCAQIEDLLPIANVRATPFKEIYKESLLAEKETTITNLRPCKDCELKFICGGGCRIKEFPQLVKRKTFKDFNPETIPARECNNQIKEKFYDLMVRSNEYFYTLLEQE